MQELVYVADPMCAWCFGFAPTLATIEARLTPETTLRYVMGGLAPDSDQPMPDAMRRYVRSAWDAVESATGVAFNREFWERCQPRRSTWPACRAVLAARPQNAERAMFGAIQRAYYTEARNPSETSVLVALATEIGLDRERFERELDAPQTREALHDELRARDALGVSGFPSLVVRTEGRTEVVMRGWVPSADVLPRLADLGAIERVSS